MARTDDLNDEEKEIVEELRMRLKKELPIQMSEEPMLLYRFLKARNFDLNKAEYMIRKNIKWRKSFQVDGILEEFKPKEFFYSYPKPSDLGLDKDGDFVKYSAMGKIDAREMLKCAKMNDYMRHWIWFCEDMVAEGKKLKEKTGRTPQLTLIIDLDHLTLSNATNKQSLDVLIRLTHLTMDNYPEDLKSAYVINAPGYYVFIFSVVKALMSNEMIEKINVYGQVGWKEKFLEIIDEDVLPAFLGGRRTDPDGNPLCETFVTRGGVPPVEFQLSKDERFFKKGTETLTLTVAARNKEKVMVDVPEVGSLIQWEFLIRGKDIGFGLFFKDSDKEVEVLPIQRFDTTDGTEEGSYKTHFNGRYIMVFDNFHSWLSSKEIEYSVTVLKPLKS